MWDLNKTVDPLISCTKLFIIEFLLTKIEWEFEVRGMQVVQRHIPSKTMPAVKLPTLQSWTTNFWWNRAKKFPITPEINNQKGRKLIRALKANVMNNILCSRVKKPADARCMKQKKWRRNSAKGRNRMKSSKIPCIGTRSTSVIICWTLIISNKKVGRKS